MQLFWYVVINAITFIHQVSVRFFLRLLLTLLLLVCNSCGMLCKVNNAVKWMWFILAAFCNVYNFIWPWCYFYLWYIHFKMNHLFTRTPPPPTALSSSDSFIPHRPSSRDFSFLSCISNIGWIIRKSWVNPALRVSDLHAAFVASLLTNPIGAALKWLALWTLTRPVCLGLAGS